MAVRNEYTPLLSETGYISYDSDLDEYSAHWDSLGYPPQATRSDDAHESRGFFTFDVSNLPGTAVPTRATLVMRNLLYEEGASFPFPDEWILGIYVGFNVDVDLPGWTWLQGTFSGNQVLEDFPSDFSFEVPAASLPILVESGKVCFKLVWASTPDPCYGHIEVQAGTTEECVLILEYVNSPLTFVGFEDGLDDLRGGTTGLVSAVASPVHCGDYALKVDKVAAYPNVVYTSGVIPFTASDVVYVTAFVQFGSLPVTTPEEFLHIQAGIATGPNLRIKANGTVAVYRGTTLLGTGTKVLTTGKWYRFDWCMNKTGGTFLLKIDGSTDVSGSYTPLSYSYSSLGVGVDYPRAGHESLLIYYDDIVISMDMFLESDPYIYRLDPDGAGSGRFWPGTPANSYADVDEVPNDGDTSYWYSNANSGSRYATLESCDSAGIPANVSLLAIRGLWSVRSIGPAAGLYYNFSNGTTVDSSDVVYPPAVYTGYERIRVLSFDGLEWTRATLDALQAGVAITQLGTGDYLRASAIHVTVLCGLLERGGIPCIAYNLGG